MKKQTRKKALYARATRWADHVNLSAAYVGADGFEAGYRAAMRDLRKLVREVEREVATTTVDPFRRVAHRNAAVRVYVQRFLRPLR